MHHVDPSGFGAAVRYLDIGDSEGDLCSGGEVPILGRIDREVHEGTMRPARGGVTATGPRIVSVVIIDMEVEPEDASIEVHRPVEIGCGEHHGHKSIDSYSHLRRMTAVDREAQVLWNSVVNSPRHPRVGSGEPRTHFA